MTPASVERRPFGRTAEGTAVELFTLRNRRGLAAAVASHGARVVSLLVPDRRGRMGDVVLGHDDLDGYLRDDRPYLGAMVGRCANRIARGELPLDGRVFRLSANEGPNHLHGGWHGFDKAVWAARPLAGGDAGVALRHVSPAGDEGYPGTLEVELEIRLTDADELAFEARARTDAPTVVALAHHGYWRLDAPARRDVLGHVLQVNADRFVAIGPGLLPTGELRGVEGTPLDFRTPMALGARVDADDEQLRLAGGYDHAYVLRRGGEGLVHAARLVGPESGRTLDVLTTEPGLQVYSGNFLDGTVVGKGGEAYGRRAAVCLETEHLPDAPHHPAFPSTVLRPGELYRTTTVYRFGLDG
jgi:aldose 1-epimerase